MSQHAPRIHKLTIDPEKIGLLIGPQGKNIRRITETTGVSIDVEDNGDVFIFSNNAAGMEAAVEEIEQLTADVELGKTYLGKVVSVKDFGAFVELLPGKDGLCHISELAEFRVRRTEDVANIGDEIWVKVIDIDERGRVRLSRKEAMAERGEKETPPPDLEEAPPERERPPRRHGGEPQSRAPRRDDNRDGERGRSRRPIRRRRPS
jgi:polyribonucleotide nucleotidyltransferase